VKLKGNRTGLLYSEVSKSMGDSSGDSSESAALNSVMSLSGKLKLILFLLL